MGFRIQFPPPQVPLEASRTEAANNNKEEHEFINNKYKKRTIRQHHWLESVNILVR